MQLKHTLGRIGLHLPRHSAKGVLIMEAPRTGSSEAWKYSQARYSNADYDPIKSFAPVASVALLPHVFVVAPAVPAHG